MRVLDIRSDAYREEWLNRMLKTAALEGEFGAGFLPQNLVDRGTALESGFPAAVAAKVQALSSRHQQVLACDRNLAVLARLCRSFWRMLQARAEVLDHSSEVFKIYGLDASGKFLIARYKRDWLKYARTLIKAEAIAVARGYPPMNLPDIASIETALAAAETSCQGVDRANLSHQAVLTDLKAARRRVDELRGDVYAYLRFALRGLSPSRCREIKRHYGYIFSGDVEQNPIASRYRPDQPEPTKLTDPTPPDREEEVDVPAPEEPKTTDPQDPSPEAEPTEPRADVEITIPAEDEKRPPNPVNHDVGRETARGSPPGPHPRKTRTMSPAGNPGLSDITTWR
ncbi:MAG: hypothetical protein QNK37_12810 [Acidobacteriota bacterium]|nr:hypothetical protein [Acidobacteriota bacterium]